MVECVSLSVYGRVSVYMVECVSVYGRVSECVWWSE